ncbi:unnamed protein product [Brassica oleracea]
MVDDLSRRGRTIVHDLEIERDMHRSIREQRDKRVDRDRKKGRRIKLLGFFLHCRIR